MSTPAKPAAADRQNLPLARGPKHQFATIVQFPSRAPSAAAHETCAKTPQPNLRELPTGALRRNAACFTTNNAPPCEVN